MKSMQIWMGWMFLLEYVMNINHNMGHSDYSSRQICWFSLRQKLAAQGCHIDETSFRTSLVYIRKWAWNHGRSGRVESVLTPNELAWCIYNEESKLAVQSSYAQQSICYEWLLGRQYFEAFCHDKQTDIFVFISKTRFIVADWIICESNKKKV